MSNALNRDPEIAIIGGGIAGLTTSLALAQYGFSVTIYEQATKWNPLGTGLQLTANAIYLLEQLGCTKESFRHYISKPKQLYVRDVTTGKQRLTIPLPSDYWHILRMDLHKILLAKLAEHDVKIYMGKRLRTMTTLQQDTSMHKLHFEDETTADATIVIGADGVKSVVRTIMQSTQSKKRLQDKTKYKAYRAIVKRKAIESTSPNDYSQLASNLTLWTGSAGHLVTYPLANGAINFVGICKFVHSTAGDHEHEVQGWSNEVNPH